MTDRRDLVKKWVNFAERDFKDAELLFRGRSYQSAAWHLQQSIEKLLKGILIKKGKRIPRIHDLIKLNEEAKSKLPKELILLLEELNFHYLPARYPDFLPQLAKIYNRRNVGLLLRRTRYLIKWLRNQQNI